jgi:hypothetical protein
VKILGRILVTLAALLILAAIWISAYWPQLLGSALLALFAGAAVLGGKPKVKP